MNQLKKNQTRTWIAAVSGLLVLGLAVAAEAHGRGGFGGGFGGPGFPGSGALLGRLLFPCPAACRDTAESCTATADSAALTCVEGACAAEITAAQTACKDDRRSQACRDAVNGLRECADTCLNTRRTAVGACRDALGDCLDACEAAE